MLDIAEMHIRDETMHPSNNYQKKKNKFGQLWLVVISNGLCHLPVKNTNRSLVPTF